MFGICGKERSKERPMRKVASSTRIVSRVCHNTMSAQIISLTPQRKDITPEEVMQMEDFKHFTQEQATELLRVVKTFCEIAYSIWSRQQKQGTTETHIIPLTPQLQKKAA